MYQQLYATSGHFRFRFPFPDEDHKKEFGGYSDFNRGLLISVPKDEVNIEIAHNKMFYRSYDNFKNLPKFGFEFGCIQSEDRPLNVYDYDHVKNQIIFEIIQQKPVFDDSTKNGFELQICVRCPYCGAVCRLSYDEVTELIKYVVKNRRQYSYLQVKSVIIAARGYKINN